MDHNIRIKNSSVLYGLMSHIFDITLIEIMMWIAETYGLCITESWRGRRHKNDLHGLIEPRANDIRSWFYRSDKAKEIEAAINKRWIYDPFRPKMKVAWIHDSGQGEHFHIQTHLNTVRRFNHASNDKGS